jgi:hypothetical protein
LPTLKTMSAEILAAVASATPGSYLQVTMPAPPEANGPTN